LNHSTSPFLVISVSWVARITGLSHWCTALFFLFACLRQSFDMWPRLALNLDPPASDA
jgi:hypothetical protein